MKRLAFVSLLAAAAVAGSHAADDKDGWHSLFDGKSLDGWKSNDEVPGVFTVENGAIKVKGGRVCFWCQRDGRDVPAEFTVLISFSQFKKVSMSCCDTITHGLFHGSSLDDQMNPIPEDE